MHITDREREALIKTYEKIEKLRKFLEDNELDSKSHNLHNWYQYLTRIKKILGNFDNDISFVACLMAKEFLMKKHPISELDVSLKSQSAPGFDIDVTTDREERIIAEIKTTIPYGKADFGAQQRKTFLNDIEKLTKASSKYKYFFVTEKDTFEIVKGRYLKDMNGITLVLLPEGLYDSTYIVSGTSYNGIYRNKSVNSKLTPEQSLSDRIRLFISKNFISPARLAGKKYIRIRSGEVHNKMGLKNRYPGVCSVMRGKKLEKLCQVKIIKTEGSDGANFYVTYELEDIYTQQ